MYWYQNLLNTTIYLLNRERRAAQYFTDNGIADWALKFNTNNQKSEWKNTVDGLKGLNHPGGEKINYSNVCLSQLSLFKGVDKRFLTVHIDCISEQPWRKIGLKVPQGLLRLTKPNFAWLQSSDVTVFFGKLNKSTLRQIIYNGISISTPSGSFLLLRVVKLFLGSSFVPKVSTTSPFCLRDQNNKIT